MFSCSSYRLVLVIIGVAIGLVKPPVLGSSGWRFGWNEESAESSFMFFHFLELPLCGKC